jgi:hypothetical protein
VNPVPGDYDINGTVDQSDYAIWRSNFGSNLLLGADGNHNDVVDAADYVLWRTRLDSGAAAGADAGDTARLSSAGAGALAEQPIVVGESMAAESSVETPVGNIASTPRAIAFATLASVPKTFMNSIVAPTKSRQGFAAGLFADPVSRVAEHEYDLALLALLAGDYSPRASSEGRTSHDDSADTHFGAHTDQAKTAIAENFTITESLWQKVSSTVASICNP